MKTFKDLMEGLKGQIQEFIYQDTYTFYWEDPNKNPYSLTVGYNERGSFFIELESHGISNSLGNIMHFSKAIGDPARKGRLLTKNLKDTLTRNATAQPEKIESALLDMLKRTTQIKDWTTEQ